MPVLSLHLAAERDSPHDVTDEQHPEALRALADLAIHSQRLSAFPKLKAKLWKKLAPTSVFIRSVREVSLVGLARADTPSLLVCVGSELRAADGMSSSSSLLDDLHSFLTSHHDVMTGQSQDTITNDSVPRFVTGSPQFKKISCGLSFAHCQLNAETLLRIESLLDRVFADPNRQFDVDVLDLSGNAMGMPELEVVLSMAKKIKNDVYGSIRELRLNNVTCGPMKETPHAFFQIVRTVLDANNVRVSRSSSARSRSWNPSAPHRHHSETSSQSSSNLKSVSWNGNRLCLKYFAAVGSALRYGSPNVEELLSSLDVQADDSLEMKQECWRWAAFGLFYPRLAWFGGDSGGSVCELRGLGRLELSADVLETIEKTLRDPVAELVYGGRASSAGTTATATTRTTAKNSESVRQLMVCAVKSGAMIDFAGQRGDSQSQSDQMMNCDERVELEALCERVDGSVCVAVPGVGLGWVQREDVDRIDRALFNNMRSANVGRYDLAPTCPMSLDSLARLESVFKVIGPQFRSLNIASSSSFLEYGGDFLGLFVKYCTHLQHLDTRDSPIRPNETESLLNAVRGKLGDRLLSLDIGSCMLEDFLAELCGVLSAREKVPALQELRLAGSDMDLLDNCISSVHGLLSVNSVIRIVELNEPSLWDAMSTRGGLYAKDLRRLEETFEGQLLQLYLPSKSKLALLSVFARLEPGGDHVSTRKEALDRWVLQQIFAFAAEELRRRIHWHGKDLEYFTLRRIPPTLQRRWLGSRGWLSLQPKPASLSTYVGFIWEMHHFEHGRSNLCFFDNIENYIGEVSSTDSFA